MIVTEMSQCHVFCALLCENIASANEFTDMIELLMQDHLLEFVEEEIVVETN